MSVWAPAIVADGVLVVGATVGDIAPLGLVCFAVGLAVGYEYERRRARKGAPRPWSQRSERSVGR